jgi:hypothetical protein
MWDIIKDLLSFIWMLLGILMVAVLVAVAGVIVTIINWLLGSDDKKRGD